MDNQVLSVLEKRISKMEMEIFGGAQIQENKETKITEALLNSHTMITSALSCRDNIVKVLERLPQLNDFLDPTYPDNEIEIEAKKEYIILLYPELRQLAKLLSEFNCLMQFADSDAIANVPKLNENLDRIVGANVNTYLDSVQATKDVLTTVNKYNEILANLEVLMMQFEQTAAQIEYDKKPKNYKSYDD